MPQRPGNRHSRRRQNRPGAYAQLARRLIAQAEYELQQRGDRLQASEKAWGATAHAIKAISQQRGWPHSSYPVLGDNAVRLARETGNANIRTLFGVASSLHQNFYENWKSADHVAGDIGDVKKLLQELESETNPRLKFLPDSNGQPPN
jgi:hypothetical protein